MFGCATDRSQRKVTENFPHNTCTSKNANTCFSNSLIHRQFFLQVLICFKKIRATSPSCRHLVASLWPPCRCCGTFSRLSLACRLPVASLSLSCRSPVAPLSLPCRFPAALLSLSCRFLSLPVVSCRHATFCLAPSCPSSVALLSFPPVALLWLFPVASLLPSCRLPVVFLPPPCHLPVASLSLPCRPTW